MSWPLALPRPRAKLVDQIQANRFDTIDLRDPVVDHDRTCCDQQLSVYVPQAGGHVWAGDHRCILPTGHAGEHTGVIHWG